MRKKMLQLCFILIVAFQCNASQIVRIDFYPGCPEELDIFFKKGFESEGYDAYVNYFDRSSDMPYDLLFRYEWKGDSLKGYLYSKDGSLLKLKGSRITSIERMESLSYHFLGELLGKPAQVKNKRGPLNRGFGEVGFDMVKLDSAIYVLTVYGSETMSMTIVKHDFLNSFSE